MGIEDLVHEYQREAASLDWFDANCWIGVPPGEEFLTVTTLAETKKQLARFGIKRAVLSHSMAKEYDAATGNAILVEEIAGHDEFLGAAVVIPGVLPAGEFRRYLEALISKKVRLVRLFPRSHNFLLSRWYAGESLTVLEELSLPTVIWHTETDWDQVARVCAEHPRLPVIIEGTPKKLFYHNRICNRLLDAFPNFFLEIHNLTNYLGVDDTVARFGSERLIFGTYFPHQDPSASTMLVTHGDLTATDKSNIAHGNLERLVEGVDG